MAKKGKDMKVSSDTDIRFADAHQALNIKGDLDTFDTNTWGDSAQAYLVGGSVPPNTPFNARMHKEFRTYSEGLLAGDDNQNEI